MLESKNLFDQGIDWREQPLIAGAAFLCSIEFVELGMRKPKSVGGERASLKPLSASSAKIYLNMFGTFMQWLGLQHKTLFDVTVEDLMRFLEHGEMIEGIFVKRLNSAIRIRYIRMLERILTHMKVDPNPAQHACFDMYRERRSTMAGQDAPKVILEPEDQQAFMQALPPLPEAKQGNEMRRWKGQRNRAMQALMLGAGLKVSEVLTLRMNQLGHIDSTGNIPVSLDAGAANRTTREHLSQLRPFAVQEVTEWLAVRRSDKDASQLLFPAKRGVNVPLDLATVYRQVKATFQRAGINAERWGGRTLRNAFAVRELAETGSTELVGELLGHRQERSTLYYQEAAERKKKMTAPS